MRAADGRSTCTAEEADATSGSLRKAESIMSAGATGASEKHARTQHSSSRRQPRWPRAGDELCVFLDGIQEREGIAVVARRESVSV